MNFQDVLFKLFLKEIREYDRLTPEQEKSIFGEYSVSHDDKLKKKLILHNMRLVIALAVKYFGKPGISKLDIVSEGVLGLSTAIQHFDPAKNCRFSTYAVFWIEAYIEKYIYENMRIVRIPQNVLEARLRIIEFKRNFLSTEGRTPNVSEIAEHFGTSEDKIMKTYDLPGEFSTDWQPDEDSDDFINYLKDIESGFYDDDPLKKEKVRTLKGIITGLKENYRTALMLRFSLDDDGLPRTFEEVGQIMGLTKERVRQLINKGIEMIRRQYYNNKEWLMEDLKSYIRDVPDFPKPGIVFKDITTLVKNPAALKMAIDEMKKKTNKLHFNKIAGIESRGFIFGSILAYKLNIPFVPVRKKGKLPADTVSETYSLEYGTDTLEMHRDAISEKDRFLIVDDLLATGGTVSAVRKMIEKNGAAVEGALFLIELDFLEGRKQLDNLKIFSIINY